MTLLTRKGYLSEEPAIKQLGKIDSRLAGGDACTDSWFTFNLRQLRYVRSRTDDGYVRLDTE